MDSASAPETGRLLMWRALRAVLLDKKLILAAKVVAIVLVAALAVVSRLPVSENRWLTKDKQVLLIVGLGLVSVITQLYAMIAQHISNRGHNDKILHSLCESAYAALDRRRPPDSKFQVTIFEPRIKFRSCWKLASLRKECWGRALWQRRLTSTARYARGEAKERSSMLFKPEEGTVGLAFSTLNTIKKTNLPPFDSPEYYNTVARECNVPICKLKESSCKSRCFVSFPVLYRDRTDRAAAVISVDSTSPDEFTKASMERISEMAETARCLYHWTF